MLIVLNCIIKLIFIALLGFFLYKKKIINEQILNFLTFFVVNISFPFLVFFHLIKNIKPQDFFLLISFFFLSLLIFFAGFILGLVFSFKKESLLKREFISLISFQNCGYLPLNLGLFLLTLPNRELFFSYIFLYLFGFDLIFWSLGSFFIFKKKEEKFSWKVLFPPPVIAELLAFLFIFGKFSWLIPEVISTPLKMVGETSFVFSLLILGSFLARINLEGFYKNFWLILEASFLKLIFLPFLFFIFIWKFKIFSLLGLFILIQSAMPSASSLPIVVSFKKGNSDIVSQGVFLSHILSILSLSFWLFIFLKVSNLNL